MGSAHTFVPPPGRRRAGRHSCPGRRRRPRAPQGRAAAARAGAVARRRASQAAVGASRNRRLMHLPRFPCTLTGAAEALVTATSEGGAWAAAIVQDIWWLCAGFPGLAFEAPPPSLDFLHIWLAAAAARLQNWKFAVLDVYRSVPCDADDGLYVGPRASAGAARLEEHGIAAEAPPARAGGDPAACHEHSAGVPAARSEGGSSRRRPSLPSAPRTFTRLRSTCVAASCVAICWAARDMPNVPDAAGQRVQTGAASTCRTGAHRALR